jgi:hypothetical protein
VCAITGDERWWSVWLSLDADDPLEAISRGSQIALCAAATAGRPHGTIVRVETVDADVMAAEPALPA